MTAKDLIIRVRDFNVVHKNVELIQTLYSLTLYHGRSRSGMTYELDNLSKLIKERPVKAKVLLAYKNTHIMTNELIGWALLSREISNFITTWDEENWFDPVKHGVLFEVYIKPAHRRMGIATELVKVARRKAKPYQLCFVPWDKISDQFYDTFSHYQHTSI